MQYTSVTDLRWADEAETLLDCTVDFAGIGAIPFTASETDAAAHSREIFARAVNGDFGSIAAYEAPPVPEPSVPAVVSMRQARLALLGAGLLSQVDAAIDDMDEPDKSAARIEWEYATELRRDHPLIAGLTEELELTEQQVDDLFIAAGQIA